MSSGIIRRLNSGSAGIADAARCPACNHHARVHNVVGCVSAHCECGVTRAELMPDAPRLEVPDGIESTPAAAPAAPAPPAHTAPAVPADAPRVPAPVAAAPAGPANGRVVVPVVELPPWLPGAGVPHVKRERPAPVVEVTTPDEDVVRQVDAIVAAGKVAARRRPRLSTARPAAPNAQGSQVVVGERDAVDGAAGPPPAATVEPEPLDLTPFLNRALTYYAAWACDRHPLQRRHDPGACLDCGRALTPVYNVVIPQELS